MGFCRQYHQHIDITITTTSIYHHHYITFEQALPGAPW